MASLAYTPTHAFPIYFLEAVLRGLYILSLFPGFLQKLDAGNQLALIEELHKEIRLIGNESKGEHVPGFCLPKKVSQGLVQGAVGMQSAVPFWPLPLSHVCSRAAGAAAVVVGFNTFTDSVFSSMAARWGQGSCCLWFKLCRSPWPE